MLLCQVLFRRSQQLASREGEKNELSIWIGKQHAALRYTRLSDRCQKTNVMKTNRLRLLRRTNIQIKQAKGTLMQSGFFSAMMIFIISILTVTWWRWQPSAEGKQSHGWVSDWWFRAQCSNTLGQEHGQSLWKRSKKGCQRKPNHNFTWYQVHFGIAGENWPG